jgi:hypothetical protein
VLDARSSPYRCHANLAVSSKRTAQGIPSSYDFYVSVTKVDRYSRKKPMIRARKGQDAVYFV